MKFCFGFNIAGANAHAKTRNESIKIDAVFFCRVCCPFVALFLLLGCRGLRSSAVCHLRSVVVIVDVVAVVAWDCTTQASLRFGVGVRLRSMLLDTSVRDADDGVSGGVGVLADWMAPIQCAHDACATFT